MELQTCISYLDPRDSFSIFYYGRLLHVAKLYYNFFVQDPKVPKEQLHTNIHGVKRSFSFVKCHDFASITVKIVDTIKHMVFTLFITLLN